MPTNNGDITFKYGSQNAYNALTTTDTNAVYVTTDTHRIYIDGVDYTADTEMNNATKQYVDGQVGIVGERVDNIIAHNNDTENNSELIDIRTGTDGTVYSSAGSAVRNQLSEITSCINDFIDTAYTSDTTEVTADETMSGTMIRQNGNTESNQYTTNLSVSKYENVSNGKYKAHGYTQNDHCLYVVCASDNTVLEYKKASNLDGAGTKDIDFYVTQDDCTVYIGGYSNVSPALYQYDEVITLTDNLLQIVKDEIKPEIISDVNGKISELESVINDKLGVTYTSDTTEITASETMSGTMIRQNGNTESNKYTTNLSVSKYENVSNGKYKAHGYTQNDHCLYVVCASDNTVLEYKKASNLDGAGTKDIDFYVTQDDCTVYIGGYSNVSPALYQYGEVVPIIADITNYLNPLYEKTVTVNGDSIAYGEGCTVNGVHYGFMDFIADRNNMTLDKQAVSGGCLSVKSTDSAGRHYICRTVENMNENADYVIFEGGYNDWYLWHRVGSITETMTDEVDDNTVYGALESICRQTLERWKTAKIGFIITHKINTAWRTIHNNSSTEHVTLEDYYQAVRDVCEKYSIPYLDLSKISRFNTELTSYKTFTYNSDGIHPKKTGYETFYVPVIERWMKNL